MGANGLSRGQVGGRGVAKKGEACGWRQDQRNERNTKEACSSQGTVQMQMQMQVHLRATAEARKSELVHLD